MTTAKSGPGKSYRKDMTLLDVAQRFGDEATAEDWFVRQRWPDGVRCAHCKSSDVSVRKSLSPLPYRCRACRNNFSVLSGTLLERTRLPLSKWVMAFHLLTTFTTNLKGVSSTKLQQELGITPHTARHLNHRVRESWNMEADKFVGPKDDWNGNA